MSHQVLARKWRPGNFTEMVGQQHVLQALVNALESGRLHHAYLFTGTRGVGKTTVARILAKCLNCDTGVTASPCGECGACAEVAEGRSVDLIEVDAASKTKVEDTRELLENVQYTPTRARYKIYLIDEVHMLSTHSFNALLKTLEEPPPHAIFLLATTDPQKLPATVLSRCLQFNLKNMQPEQIVSHLEHILAAESVSADPESLALIARAAEGSMRDALSLTDQAIAYGEGQLGGAQVAEMLGTVDRGKVLELASAILDESPAEVLSLVAQIAEHAPDYVSTLDELSSIFHQMTIAQTVPGALDTSWPDQSRIAELAACATIDDTQLFWQMSVSGRREVHLASSARAGLEMILLRMIAFRPAAVIQPAPAAGDPPAKKPDPPALPVDLTAVESDQPELVKPQVNRAAVDATSAPPAKTSPIKTSVERRPNGQPARENGVDSSPNEPGETALNALTNESTEGCADSGPLGQVVEQTVDHALNAAQLHPVEADHQADAVPASPAARAESLTSDSWPERFERLVFSGILHNIALNLALQDASNDVLAFVIAPQDATLLNDRHQSQLTQSLSQQLDRPVTATISITEHVRQTPAHRRAALAAARLAEAERAISNDTSLHDLMAAFDAQIIPGSIQPNLAEGAADTDHPEA